jgi:hypothetical protein
MSEPQVRPIPFSGPMVLALLAGTKTQTRRVITPPLSEKAHSPFQGADGLWRWMTGDVSYRDDERRCPCGQPGDRLWVRETWGLLDIVSPCYRADDKSAVPASGRWRPSIHMPRWASRLTLEVTEVRVQLLQEISEEDAKAEGVEPIRERVANGVNWSSAREGFHHLWDSINGERAAWESNPWVWAVSFKVLRG